MLTWLKRAFGQHDAQQQPETPDLISTSNQEQRVALKQEGDAAMALGDFSLAEQWYKKAFDLAPNDAALACRLAFSMQEQGKSSGAEKYAQEALALDSTNADALYLLAQLAAARAQTDLAIRYFHAALRAAPDFIPAYAGCAQLLLEQGRLAEATQLLATGLPHAPDRAELHGLLGNLHYFGAQFDAAKACFAQAAALDPYNPEHLKNLGSTLMRLGDADAAATALSQSLALRPDAPDAMHALGNARQMLGNDEEAEFHYRAALALQPDRIAAWFDLGNLSYAGGKADEAIACYHTMLALNTDDADANFHLGIIFDERKNHEAAIAHYERALQTMPGRTDIRINLGNALKEQRSYDTAMAVYEQALSQEPDNVTIQYNMGVLYQAMEQPAQAGAAYLAVLASDPEHFNACINLGLTYQVQRNHAAAAQYIERARSINPDSVAAHINLGSVYINQRRFDEAMDCFDKAIKIDPDSADAISNRGLLALLLGRFESGWKDYEYRNLQTGVAPRNNLLNTAWLNDADIKDKTLLIYADQGMGDAIQFLRYESMLASFCANVILEVHTPLQPLFAHMLGRDRVFAKGDGLPPYDFHCAIASLPLVFQTRLETIPNTIPYLSAPPDKVAAYRNEFAALCATDMPRIGVVWAGNPQFKNDHNRSVPVERFKPLFAQERYRFFILQKESAERIGQDDGYPKHINNLAHKLSDFSDTAGIVANLDLVISVDTSVAHLAGAMGKPVWILLPHTPDFRWLLDRSDSPWYPSARLFRQMEPGNWKSVIDDVIHTLETEFA